MTELIFYEKPGCMGNLRQQTLLELQGVSLQVKNLLAEPWTPEALLSYLASMPVSAWFNTSAPRVKSGEVNPQLLDADEALSLLLADPILIRRPLLAWGEIKQAGFEMGPVLRALEIDLSAEQDWDGCPAALDMSACQSA